MSDTHEESTRDQQLLEELVSQRTAQLEQSLSAELFKPHFQRLDQNLTTSVSAHRNDTEAFEEQALTSRLSIERPLDEHWRGSLGALFEIAKIEDEDGDRRSVITGAPAGLNYDTTDDVLDPSKGVRLAFQVMPAVALGGRTATFVSATVGGSTYHDLFGDRRLIAAGRAEVGSIAGAARQDIPATHRLYAGGAGSIRGYDFQTVGPLDSGDPVGGRSLVELNAELRFRISEDFGIVPFIDGGSAFSDSIPGGESLRWAAGLGLRYYTAIGPIRLDVARPLNRRDDIDDSFEFFISIGQAF
ncbi:MAG: outer membrane protein assembly factor [Pirellulales bacterium]|nr:outer membrane protein assembly factor [Pirellulales bacterium]